MSETLRHFLDLDALDASLLRRLVDEARWRKEARRGRARGALDDDAPLAGRILALIFEKPSTRTRVSFDVGMRQLGGETLTLHRDVMQLGRGETIADTAQVLSRFVDALMIRADAHSTLLDLASAARVPVVNGLTDHSHPCQLLADILTFEEHQGPIKGRSVAWIGDGNNVATSWIHAAVKFDFGLRLACPASLSPNSDVLDWAAREGGRILLTQDPKEAAAGTDCVVTDTWVSMGDKDAVHRMKVLQPYQVDHALMALAGPRAIFMHCLPAHRGEEVTGDVIDGPQSVVIDGAENRLHAQKSVLLWCLTGGQA